MVNELNDDFLTFADEEPTNINEPNHERDVS